MKKAEEIFNKHSWEALGAISPSKDFCIKAMKEYGELLIKEQRELMATYLATHFNMRNVPRPKIES